MKTLRSISTNESSKFLLADWMVMQYIDMWLGYNNPNNRFLRLYKSMIILPYKDVKKKKRIYEILTTYMIKKEVKK